MRPPFAAPAPLAALAALAATALGPPASAAGPAFALAPRSPTQPALAVGFDAAGALRAQVCPAERCEPGAGAAVGDAPALAVDPSTAELRIVRLARDRRAVLVSAPLKVPGQRFEAIVAAPVGGGGAPVVVFQGVTGSVEGVEGERRGPMVVLGEPDAQGFRTLVVGEQREDLTLCGRPTVLSPRLVNPRDLALRPARVQRLPAAEREAAPRVVATEESAAPAAAGLLVTVAASSAVGRFDALTDGDPATAWAEARGGAGRGEFVLMRAPAGLPFSAFELVVRPAASAPEPASSPAATSPGSLGPASSPAATSPGSLEPASSPAATSRGGGGGERPHAIAPTALWLAFEGSLVHVTVPPEAWRTPGSRWRVALPKPVASECVAVVLDEGAAARPGGAAPGKDAEVTLAEVRARTEFDGMAPEALVAALAGGGERARAAAGVLLRLGAPGRAAVDAAFAGLDDAGAGLALDVVDAAPCAEAVPTTVAALARKPLAARASARLGRCGAVAAEPLAALVARAPAGALLGAGAVLVEVDPARAVPALARRLEGSDAKLRARLRNLLFRAAEAPAAAAAVRATLADATLPLAATIDLLRALGERLPRLQPEAGVALRRAWGERPTFATRYLLLPAAGRLAAADAEAGRWLGAAAADADGRLRAQAARSLPAAAAHDTLRLALLRDPEVRVREAVLLGVGPGTVGMSAPVLAALREDGWPLVREAAARAAERLPAAPGTDQALAEALDDAAPTVRQAALRALGARRATVHGEAVRSLFTDRDETPELRAVAAETLGELCHRGAVEDLTRAARWLGEPSAPEPARRLGHAALGALARLHPPDLRERLAPLLAKGAPLGARQAAERAIAQPGACR